MNDVDELLALAGVRPVTRRLEDGRELTVCPITFGRARLCVGEAGALGYDDFWCYESWPAAIAAMQAWNGEGEPSGWVRHTPTGRRRPGGDASKEYVLP